MSSIDIVANAPQFEKALFSILVIELGMINEVKLLFVSITSPFFPLFVMVFY